MPANNPITILDLMRHTSGIAYGEIDRDPVIREAYRQRGLYHPDGPEYKWGALMGSQVQTGRYGSDVYFTGGAATNLFAAKNPMTPATAQKIDGTEDQLQAATYRHGRFSYDIPVPNGTYRVQLGFVEPSFDKPGQRVFNVTANGDEVLTGLDLVAIAGGPLREVERHFDCTIEDGKLRLAFLPVTDEAVLSTIQISPEP